MAVVILGGLVTSTMSWRDAGHLDEVARRIEWSRTHRHLFE
jgi:hypothetical protein